MRDTLTDNGCMNRLSPATPGRLQRVNCQRNFQPMIPLSVWVRRLLFPFNVFCNIRMA